LNKNPFGFSFLILEKWLKLSMKNLTEQQVWSRTTVKKTEWGKTDPQLAKCLIAKILLWCGPDIRTGNTKEENESFGSRRMNSVKREKLTKELRQRKLNSVS
jgi:hypothetical protein